MKDLHSSRVFDEESVADTASEEVVFNVVSASTTTATAETLIPKKPRHIQEPPLSVALGPVVSSGAASSDVTTTVLYGIRHGLSVSNEWMRREGNVWGSPTYNDEHNIPDAPLSETGIQQAKALCQYLQETRQQQQQESSGSWLDNVQLIVVSPLTRCLQTYQHALEPLEQFRPIPVLALPLLTERVYSISETGRPVAVLQAEFPQIDWSLFDTPPWKNVKDCWWYDPTVGGGTTAYQQPQQPQTQQPHVEWRPTGQGQRYLAAGEPPPVFERRMAALHQWLVDRPERSILAVSHWGVLRHFTDGEELDHCQVCAMKLMRK